MLNQFHESEPEILYDAQMQQRVVERAARLQQEEQEQQSVHQIVDAAREIGIEPHHVHRAIEQVLAEPTTSAVVQTRAVRQVSHSRAEFQRFVTAITAPIGVGALAFALKDVTGLAVLFSLILPAPLACLSGFLTGRKRVGFVTAVLLILALAPTVFHLGIHEYYRDFANEMYRNGFLQQARNSGFSDVQGYLMLGAPFAGLLGAFGAWTRQRYLPHPPAEVASPRP